MNAPLPASALLPALDGVRAHEAEMIALRHQIHEKPELAYEEHATSDLVAERLQRWGYEVHRGLGGTGVVGTLRTGTSTRRIGLRADMDALPIAETSGRLWAIGMSFYDVGYSVDFLIEIALTNYFASFSNTALAEQLVFAVPGTGHTSVELISLMNSQGGSAEGALAGRVAAVKLMADSPQNMATIDSEGLRLNGIACDLTVDGVVLFGLVPG